MELPAQRVVDGNESDVLDLAVIGAGVAGTWVAQTMQRARPEWSIAVFERSSRIGGRVRSVKVPGWAEGALETADAVTQRLLAAP